MGQWKQAVETLVREDIPAQFASNPQVVVDWHASRSICDSANGVISLFAWLAWNGRSESLDMIDPKFHRLLLRHADKGPGSLDIHGKVWFTLDWTTWN
jgi:hypothetical protein